MKKVRALAAGIILSFILVSCASTSGEKVKASPQKDYKFDFSTKTLGSFSVVDLDEELEVLKYLMQTTYAGYETAVANGFDIDRSIGEIKKDVLENLNSLGMIDTARFQKTIFNVFMRDMKNNDMHFSVHGYDVGAYNQISKDICWTDIYVGEENGKLVIIQSGSDKIPVGAEYTGGEKNLYKAFLGDKEVYRYGVFSNPNTKRLTVSLEGESVPVSVTEKGKWFYKENNTNVIETEESVYVSLSSFSMYGNPLLYNLFFDLCKKISNTDPEKPLILDLRSNSGGSVFLADQLVASIYYPFDIPLHMEFYDFLMMESGKYKNRISSSALDQYNEYTKKEWELRTSVTDEYNRELEKNEEDADIAEIFYKEPLQHKKVYVLMDEDTASASEYAIGLLGLVPDADVTLIGSRTYGSVSYYDLHRYPLPKSGLYLRLATIDGAPPYITDDDHFFGEGEGFRPDWWVSNDQLLNTLIQLTGDQSLSEYLRGLEKWQL